MDKLYGHTSMELLDTRQGGKWFAKHMDAMTREGLHSKADIAAELAYRDNQITELEAALKRIVDEYREYKKTAEESGYLTPVAVLENQCGQAIEAAAPLIEKVKS